MKKTVGLISLGCSKNQVDAEHMLAALRDEGFLISSDISSCDAVIINTCGFIKAARRESAEQIKSLGRQKNKKLRILAVTGCLAERYQGVIKDKFPEADVILGLGSMPDIALALNRAFAGERVVSFGDKLSLSLDGERILANAPWFAYLKIAEGCDNRCAYCAIPDIRGAFRSRPMERIIAEAQSLAQSGVKELNIVAQDTTRYGEDLYKKPMLPKLLDELCAIEEIKWIRLLYCYPERISDELIDTVANHDKIVKYFDIPLQHIDDRVLARMNRRGDSEYIEGLLKKIRSRIPGAVIRTTFITGLPGEDVRAFERLAEFVRRQRFERLGCFAYSPEKGTPGQAMTDRADARTARLRARRIMRLQRSIAGRIARRSHGSIATVLCEGYDERRRRYVGRSAADAPDVDTKVFFSSALPIGSGSFARVLITGSDGYDLLGRLV
jgi:ribosomal protein S12 methylthiotransferase